MADPTQTRREPSAEGAGSGRDSRPPAITVHRVGKTFEIPAHRPATLKERALHPFRRIPGRRISAARDLSFEVGEGEFFGIVGRNGSGKSTLLRMLAGIYRPDSGEIEVRGRVSPFIELGVGFNMELKARDNVLINGTMLGVPRAEIQQRYPDIIEFAGLGGFEDLALKNYSSGMLARLGFSTAIQVDADVLLLDEVLAVGDADFQEKCFDEFRRLKREGRTIVFVSHAMDAVRRFCDRAMLMEDGGAAMIGEPERVAEAYRELSRERAVEPRGGFGEGERFGDGSAKVVDSWIEDESGKRVNVALQGHKLALCAEFTFAEAADNPVLGVQVKGEAGVDVLVINTLFAGHETGDFAPGDRAVLRVELDNHLGVGVYSLTPGVASRDGTRIADIRFDHTAFRVDGMFRSGAIADLPFEITVEAG